MTRPDLNRPIIIPMHKGDLSRSVLSSNLRTLGITKQEFEALL